MADNEPTPQKGVNRAHSRQAPNFSLPSQLLERIEYVPISELKAYSQNPRKHPRIQLRRLCASIKKFGFLVPVLVDAKGTILAGHARVAAAGEAGLSEIPIIRVTHLSKDEQRAFRLADNRLTELAEWDNEVLATELQALLDVELDMDAIGFEAPEIDQLIEQLDGSIEANPADALPPADENGSSVVRPGDLFEMDNHRFICGDARDPAVFDRLLEGQLAQMVISDPPYNVEIDGNVCGLGSVHHPEFAMASGEMTDTEFEAFIAGFVQNLVKFSSDGSVHFLFIDWRHLQTLTAVCNRYFTEHLNLCVWAKTNAGMGSLYRSQHELIVVFKNGSGPHINNIMLGKYGRNRTNVWNYEGVNTLNPNRRKELALHPTVKPAALVADAIKDCSERNGIVMDAFIGSGTTIIAAEKTGRRCFGIEIDPIYCDVAIRRWQDYTAGTALHVPTGLTFAELEAVRRSDVLLLPPPAPGAVEKEA